MPLLDRAEKVTESLGTSTGELVRMFLSEIARTGRVPLSMSAAPNSDILKSKELRDRMMRSLDDTESW